jgi:hypothetical protein
MLRCTEAASVMRGVLWSPKHKASPGSCVAAAGQVHRVYRVAMYQAQRYVASLHAEIHHTARVAVVHRGT